MSIRKLKSKKYGYIYQVDMRYKDPYGVTQRHTKSGFRTKKEARNYEASIIEKSNAKVLIPESRKRTLNDVFDVKSNGLQLHYIIILKHIKRM